VAVNWLVLLLLLLLQHLTPPQPSQPPNHTLSLSLFVQGTPNPFPQTDGDRL